MNRENAVRPEDDRRAFLKKCGRFAAITPPAVTFLLSTSMSSKAIAGSSGRIRDGDDDGGGLLGIFGAGAGAVAVAGAPRPEKQVRPGELAPPAPAPTTAAPTPPPPVPVPSPVGERG